MWRQRHSPERHPGPVYIRRQPEKTALYQVVQRHLLTFEQEWTDEASGRTLPKFVTAELHGFMACGILGRGFAHLFCKTCREYHAVAFSCKARAVCPTAARSCVWAGHSHFEVVLRASENLGEARRRDHDRVHGGRWSGFLGSDEGV